MLYVGSPLPLRNVEDLLQGGGIEVGDETGRI
jgi:transposase-like protein